MQLCSNDESNTFLTILSQEAADIFGDVDDLVKMYEESRAAQRGEDPLAVIEEELRAEAEEEAEEGLQAAEEDDEEAAERKRLAMEERRKQKMYQVRLTGGTLTACHFHGCVTYGHYPLSARCQVPRP
jgi:biopolymer transport protein ExbB/TolQ